MTKIKIALDQGRFLLNSYQTKNFLVRELRSGLQMPMMIKAKPRKENPSKG